VGSPLGGPSPGEPSKGLSSSSVSINVAIEMTSVVINTIPYVKYGIPFIPRRISSLLSNTILE
jgi:hypothetical protein